MTDRDEFSGRTALITGGTRGIGKGIADRLRAGGVAALADEALRRLGKIDIAIHNVGGSGQSDGGAASLTDDDWRFAALANYSKALSNELARQCPRSLTRDSESGQAT
jgi:NAD(P)-dependent dehydrogenase (short-subunit alcohol dehydrogenase family)